MWSVCAVTVVVMTLSSIGVLAVYSLSCTVGSKAGIADAHLVSSVHVFYFKERSSQHTAQTMSVPTN